jgi:DNA-binding response OmpR family regulator
MPSTLLLIDDDPQVVLAHVKRAFSSPAMQVEVARTGKEVVALASKRRPDLALLDVSLLDMDGLEVYRRLREIDARITVISPPLRREEPEAMDSFSSRRLSASVWRRGLPIFKPKCHRK